MHILESIVILAAMSLNASQADDQLNLKSLAFPLPAPSQNAEIFDRGLFEKGGRRYHKYESSLGAIYVLETEKLSPHDFETAQCASRAGPGSIMQIDQYVPVAGAEAKMSSRADWKVYASLIQRTIQTSCDGQENYLPIPINPNLEIGITHKSDNPNAAIKEYRVFNRGLLPNLNFGADF